MSKPLPKCCGVFGYLFGHKFRPRYSENVPDLPFMVWRELCVEDLVETVREENYHYDVCERCGQVADDSEPETAQESGCTMKFEVN